MILTRPLRGAGLLLAGCLLFLSCSKKQDSPGIVPRSDTMQYSIRNYLLGQLMYYHGEPLVLQRIYTDGDKVDSTFVPINDIPLKEIVPPFMNSDISSPEFIGKYDFAISDDNVTASRILTYTAKRRDLFTQLFQITTDPVNFKVKSLYVETRNSGFWKSTSQKLLYVPRGIVQIQETEDPLIGATQKHRLEYRFPGTDNDDVNIVE